MKGNASPRAWATIDLQALQANFRLLCSFNTNSKIVAVIKANAYGHGMAEVATTLNTVNNGVDVFAVATMDEVQALLALETGKRILLFSGFRNRSELQFLLAAGVELVIHSSAQLDLLQNYMSSAANAEPITVWLKLDTGMHRLGMDDAELLNAYHSLSRNKRVGEIVLMSHLASADDVIQAQALSMTRSQITKFSAMYQQLKATESRLSASLAASAAILSLPETHYDYLRPGIMLYGASPLAGKSAESLGLHPVMTLSARILTIKAIAAGDTVGYGGSYTCTRTTLVAVVSIGYADGYPRAAGNGTPVLVKTAAGIFRTSLIGRVSMDMLSIDLTDIESARVGDEVVLWGKGLPVDEIAAHAKTISYELCCRVTRRVSYSYS